MNPPNIPHKLPSPAPMFGQSSDAPDDGGDTLTAVQARGSPNHLPTTSSSQAHSSFQRIRPTTCECGQSFTHNWHLRRHKKMCALHQRNKPRDLLCACGRRFGESSDMAQHIASSNKHKEDKLRFPASSTASHSVLNKAPLNPLAMPFFPSWVFFPALVAQPSYLGYYATDVAVFSTPD